ncbi:type II secretion system protein [Candidatus Microgenomates bacterium]|nr:MAG: type II secretion system protein [Candidatus Microgenomates bacterium]
MLKTQGFTLIELMISFSMISIVFVLGVSRFIEFNRVQSTSGAGQTVKNNLRRIQSLGLSGSKPIACLAADTLEGYRVTFTDTKTYTAQAVCDSGPAGPVTTYTLPADFTFNTPLPDSFTFYVLGNGASANRTIVIKGYANPVMYYAMCVSTGGDIKDCGYKSVEIPSCSCPY